LTAGATAAEAAEARLLTAHDALMHARGLQHDFPPPPLPPTLPVWLQQLIEFLARFAPVLKVLFWAGLAATAALVLWLIVRDLPLARRFLGKPAASAGQPEAWRPSGAAAHALLAEADQLAAAGRYDEAIHLLLFRSIQDIGATRPAAVRAALTSRDIVDAAPLSESGRAAFRRIAAAVERSFFAGRAADRETFDACRAHYQAFALAEAAP